MTTSFIRLFFVHKINEKTTEGELDMLKIQDFCDMNKFESIMDAWAKSTGLATVAVGSDGEESTSASVTILQNFALI